MPVYNSSSYINKSIESILQQTYLNFELLIYDDNSTDGTLDIIRAYKDKRIIIFRKEHNTGYTESLRRGISAAKGKYIARMDSDDISFLTRFARQVDFLEDNPEYGIVGTQLRTIEESNEGQIWTYPLHNEDIKLHLLVDSPFAHPSVMIRKEVLEKNNLNYETKYEPCEDYKLWVDLLSFTKGANLNEVLVYYRLHDNQTIKMKRNTLLNNSNLIRHEVIKKIFGTHFTDQELLVHYYFFNEIGRNNLFTIQDKFRWKKKLLKLFENTFYKSQGRKLVEKYWLFNLRTLTEYRPLFIKYIFNRFLIQGFSFLESTRFIIKCLISYKISKS